ncbi:MAG: IS982 family transposase [Chloroflexi bacterium]|nr:IS982 family transposase [Chloroflexota bacterium]
MDSLTELFCDVDDFCQSFVPVWQRQMLSAGEIQRQRERSLSTSEIMTILIHFHQSHYRNFKAYYTEYVLVRLRKEFPGLVSYNRFVKFIPSVLVALCVYLRTACLGTCTGISFIDSTALAVCKNPRIHSHKVFAGLAERGKTSTGWFFGFKLHLIFNDQGELLNLLLTPGNVDDRKPVPKMVRKLFGKLFGDKGYLSKTLRDELLRTFHVQLVTGIRSNMKNMLMPLMDKILLRKRAIAETIIDQLKNISQIEHSRHRSPINFLVNLICGLIAYCRQPKKPSLGLGTLPALVA